jgi:hypothetical protein
MHIRVSAGQQFALGIIHIHLDPQRARGWVDRVVGTRQDAGESFSGIFVDCYGRPRAYSHRGSIALGHRDVDAQHFDRRRMEQFGSRSTGAGIDQVADIGVAHGDHASERRIDILVGLQLRQPIHIGLARHHDRLIGDEGRSGVVAFMRRYRLGLQQVLGASRRGAGQLCIGLRGRQIGARLAQLLVKLGRLDLREQNHQWTED